MRKERSARLLVATLASFLLIGGAALAIGTGLQNPSFENDLDNWTVKTVRDTGTNREVVYGPGGLNGASVPCDSSRYGICVIGQDSFPFVDSDGDQTATVNPVDGSKMVRLGGPYNNDDQHQNQDVFVVEQTFVVDPDNPILELNYNIFTFDYLGYDEARFIVRLTDEDGALITRDAHGAFGSGIDLKTSGWRPNHIDLSGYEGQQVHLKIESAGTQDTLFGFWTYIDAGMIPESPVSGEDAHASAPNSPSGNPVIVDQQSDPGSGLTYFLIGASQVSQFPSGCMPLTLNVPINPGTGTVSNVNLFVDGVASAMSETPPGSGVWRATIACVEDSDLALEYDLTEGGTTQHFVVPLGGIALIDPQGVVFDTVQFAAAIAGGQTPEQARATAAISGATVRLQRQNVSGGFDNVLSGDPGISPNVNPETTGSDGRFQWDVAAGIYRVSVTAPGHHPATSSAVTIPPPVLDLHVGLAPILPPAPVAPVAPPPPAATGKRAAALKKCKKKHGAKRKKCKKKASKLPV